MSTLISKADRKKRGSLNQLLVSGPRVGVALGPGQRQKTLHNTSMVVWFLYCLTIYLVSLNYVHSPTKCLSISSYYACTYTLATFGAGNWEAIQKSPLVGATNDIFFFFYLIKYLRTLIQGVISDVTRARVFCPLLCLCCLFFYI